MKIPFNKPYFTGKEAKYIKDAVASGKISGDGKYTYKCHEYFEKAYSFNKTLLTTSCTDALEMAAILCDVRDGDEVIVPSYTFVSTANAFVLRGAKIVFADSERTTPNIDVSRIEELVTERTKVIVPVHYAGIACDMDKITDIAKRNNLLVVEDAAQAIESFYKGKPLGTFGDFSTFSFHETKNVISGEGGMLVINNDKDILRSEIIREKGTNRSAFFRGEVDKYGWVDVGSSFLPSDIVAAFLYSQLEHLNEIQEKRIKIWNEYFNGLAHLQDKGILRLPLLPHYASNNAHMFFIICENLDQRSRLITHLNKSGIMAVFHYQSLHKSIYYNDKHDGRQLPNSDLYTDCLLRLPIFFELKIEDVYKIIDEIYSFFNL